MSDYVWIVLVLVVKFFTQEEEQEETRSVYQKLENKTVQVDNFKNADVANTIVDKIMVDNQNYIKEMSDMG